MRLRLLVAEDAERAPDLARLADDIDAVADQHRVRGARHEEPAFAEDADHHRLEVGEKLGELRQRGIDDRTVLPGVDADHHHIAIGEADEVRSPGRGKAPEHQFADLDFRRDDHVDRQMLAREQVRPVRLEVALRADAGDLGRHVEERSRHLAGDHVDLVVQGHRDDHVGLVDAGLGEHVRMSAVADQAADVERIADRLYQSGDVSTTETSLSSAASCSAMPKPTCPAPQITTRMMLPRAGHSALADAERLQLPVQRRALHADELGGARDVAAEAVDLGA